MYSVAGRRPFRSYSTVFPDTICVTSGSKKQRQKRGSRSGVPWYAHLCAPLGDPGLTAEPSLRVLALSSVLTSYSTSSGSS